MPTKPAKRKPGRPKSGRAEYRQVRLPAATVDRLRERADADRRTLLATAVAAIEQYLEPKI